MATHHDWDPRAPDVLADPIGTYDNVRRRCPVAYSEYLRYSIFRHADVMRVLMDPDTFSNQASRHLSVPNSMDPPEHTAYRRMIDPYFNAARMAEFEPVCRRICAELVAALPHGTAFEVMFGLAHPFALRMQCAFLGWPASLHEPLLQWINKKNVATLSGDTHTIAAVATEFDETIRTLLKARREAGDDAPRDATTRLLRETVNGQPLAEEEIVSILRNWTVGELSTIASSAGIVVYYLAQNVPIQSRLRRCPALVRAAIDEILRIHAPLAANRRMATRAVRIGTTQIPPGERLTLMWASANRDDSVFGNPDEFRLDRDPALNLLYGAGIHACPGAPLARLELTTLIQVLLADTQTLEPSGQPPTPATYPASGYYRASVVDKAT